MIRVSSSDSGTNNWQHLHLRTYGKAGHAAHGLLSWTAGTGRSGAVARRAAR